MMKKTILSAFITLGLLNASGQRLQHAGEPVKTRPGVDTLPGGTCHWTYGIRRTNTTNDGKYYYQINFSLSQLSSRGYPSGTVKMEDAKIVCSFKVGAKNYSVRFFPKDDEWIAKFFIQTYKAVPVTITAEYFHQKSVMTEVTLNQGRYPGEN